MNTWKVTVQPNGKIIEFTVSAKTFPEAYIQAELAYPKGRILTIKKLENDKKKKF